MSYLVCDRCQDRLGLVEMKTVKFRRPEPFEPIPSEWRWSQRNSVTPLADMS